MADSKSQRRGLFIATANVPELQQMFSNPEQWNQTRDRLRGIILSQTDWRASDEDLRKWFAALKQWGLELQLEVPALKDKVHNGEEVFRQQRVAWQRLQQVGANITAIAMDEPFGAMRLAGMPLTYSIEQTAEFVRLVHKTFPGIRVGDIEPYPFFNLSEHKAWLEGVQAALRRSGDHGLDFYRADVDWNAIALAATGTWPDVRQLESFVHQIGLQFSMIYCAADYGEAEKRGIGDDQTWFTETMHEGYTYQAAGGTPDEYVIESWVAAPFNALPEAQPFTFTYTALQFAKKFVR